MTPTQQKVIDYVQAKPDSRKQYLAELTHTDFFLATDEEESKRILAAWLETCGACGDGKVKARRFFGLQKATRTLRLILDVVVKDDCIPDYSNDHPNWTFSNSADVTVIPVVAEALRSHDAIVDVVDHGGAMNPTAPEPGSGHLFHRALGEGKLVPHHVEALGDPR